MIAANTVLRHSAKRIVVFSQAGMSTRVAASTSTKRSKYVLWPSDSTVTKRSKPESPFVRFTEKFTRDHSVRCLSKSSTTLEEDATSDAGMAGSAESDNLRKPQESPLSSPLANGAATTTRKRTKKFVPRKAAVELTERARTLFQKLLENHPSRDGILLNYNQSSTGEPRMVFSFSFVSKDELDDQDEGVSLEIDEDGNPKSPRDALDDGLPKLYVHHNAFLKVLGATVDVDTEKITPVLYNKDGHELDANA